MADAVVDVRGLTKSYGRREVVSDVTFRVGRGRVVGLLGRNGAGKTTTLRCVLGLAAPDRGDATVLGAPVRSLPDAATRVGVALDDTGFTQARTAPLELRLWCRYLGLPRERADEVLEQVGLADATGTPLTGFSTGMRRRLSLAIAMLGRPEVLVLDEPVNGLDPEGVRWVRRTLRALADGGCTVLLSSHLLAEVEQTVDDVVVLDRTVRFAGPLDELTDHGRHRLEDRFFELLETPAEVRP